MVLVIDIGNTNIVLGLFKGKRLLKTSRIPTQTCQKCQTLSTDFPVKSVRHFQRDFRKVEGVIISSVVPEALKKVKRALKSELGLKPLVLGENTKVPIKNRYKRPGQVGQDRLANAFAALNIYKRRPIIIVDFGTAVTIDAISKNGAYLGGVIVPGVELSIENLTKRAALLPKITLKRPKDILGKSTAESMLSGIFYGYASLCDGIIERLRKKFKSRPLVIATGGYAKILSSYCRRIDRIDTQLTLKGLNLIYSKKNS